MSFKSLSWVTLLWKQWERRRKKAQNNYKRCGKTCFLMIEVFLFHHPPYCLLDLGINIFIFLLKVGAIRTAPGKLCVFWRSLVLWEALEERVPLGISLGNAIHPVCPQANLSAPQHIQGWEVLPQHTCYALVCLGFTICIWRKIPPNVSPHLW